jgi:hypothetical protein
MSVEKNAKVFAEERVNFLIDNNYIDIEEDARDKEYIAKHNNRRTQKS